MLVLSRQNLQTICIGDDIKVTVAEIRGNKVRLAIDAPKDTAVHRLEVFERIQRDKEAA